MELQLHFNPWCKHNAGSNDTVGCQNQTIRKAYTNRSSRQYSEFQGFHQLIGQEIMRCSGVQKHGYRAVGDLCAQFQQRRWHSNNHVRPTACQQLPTQHLSSGQFKGKLFGGISPTVGGRSSYKTLAVPVAGGPGSLTLQSRACQCFGRNLPKPVCKDLF